MHRIYSKCFHNYDYEKLKEIRIFSKFISQLRYFTYSTIHYTYKVFKNLLTEYEKMPLKNKQVIEGHKKLFDIESVQVVKPGKELASKSQERG